MDRAATPDTVFIGTRIVIIVTVVNTSKTLQIADNFNRVFIDEGVTRYVVNLSRNNQTKRVIHQRKRESQETAEQNRRHYLQINSIYDR